MTSANMTVYATLGPVARGAGISEIEVGLIFATSGLLFSLTSSAWGRAADRHGGQLVIFIGLLGTALSSLIFAGLFDSWRDVIGAVNLFAAFLLARILYGLLAGGVQPAATAWVVQTASDPNRATGAARVGAVVGLGSVIGPALAASSVDAAIWLPLMITGLLSGLAAIVILLAAAAPAVTPKPAHREKELTSPDMLRVYIVAFLFYFGLAALQPTIAFFVQDRFHVETALAIHRGGLVSATFAGCALFVQAFWIRRLPLSARCLLSTGIAVSMLGFASGLLVTDIRWLLAAFALAGIGYGLAQPGLMIWALLGAARHGQAEAAGRIQAAASAAWVVGPFAGTAVYAIDFRGALAVAVTTMALALAVTIACRSQATPPPVPSVPPGRSPSWCRRSGR